MYVYDMHWCTQIATVQAVSCIKNQGNTFYGENSNDLGTHLARVCVSKLVA